MRLIVVVLSLTIAALVVTVASLGARVQADPGFKLPWSAGEAYRVFQAGRGPSHECPGYNCHAYDFGLPVGTPVRASAGGSVTVADGSQATGGCDPSHADRANYIYIAHGDGSRTLYLHLKDVVVSRGQEVAQGELIGHSGRTGYACSAHLHFQRDVDGESAPVDFDEYPGRPLNVGQLVTSQNSPPPWTNAGLPCGPDARPADFNDDGKVDGRDVLPLAQRFGSTTTSTPAGKLPYTARYDLNADTGIDGLDVYILAQYFNTSCP